MRKGKYVQNTMHKLVQFILKILTDLNVLMRSYGRHGTFYELINLRFLQLCLRTKICQYEPK